ncbi:hypothetical protein TNCV_1395381 [Trichonephila clavipes]|nr:hypothetical protein TNCV_1395381 [Trichonephila clavipes]
MSTFELLQPLSSTIRKNLSISTLMFYIIIFQPSTSSISIPTCTDAPFQEYGHSLLNHLPQSYQLPHHSPLFTSDSNTVQDAKKLAKARSRKRKKKELLKKMKEAIIDIKMNPHRPKTGLLSLQRMRKK